MHAGHEKNMGRRKCEEDAFSSSSSSSAWTKRMPKREFRSASASPSCRRGAARELEIRCLLRLLLRLLHSPLRRLFFHQLAAEEREGHGVEGVVGRKLRQGRRRGTTRSPVGQDCVHLWRLGLLMDTR